MPPSLVAPGKQGPADIYIYMYVSSSRGKTGFYGPYIMFGIVGMWGICGLNGPYVMWNRDSIGIQNPGWVVCRAVPLGKQKSKKKKMQLMQKKL